MNISIKSNRKPECPFHFCVKVSYALNTHYSCSLASKPPGHQARILWISLCWVFELMFSASCCTQTSILRACCLHGGTHYTLATFALPWRMLFQLLSRTNISWTHFVFFIVINPTQGETLLASYHNIMKWPPLWWLSHHLRQLSLLPSELYALMLRCSNPFQTKLFPWWHQLSKFLR